MTRKSDAGHKLFDPGMIRRSIGHAFSKLNPRHMVRNPVMFVVLIGSVVTSVAVVQEIIAGSPDVMFTLQISIWLWFTVLFANFAEAMAEGRGKAQAEALRATRTQTVARTLKNLDAKGRESPTVVPSSQLKVGDIVICSSGDVIPGDGEVIEGVASVDESAITGESAPVIRESGGDRSAVTGGTKVLSDWIIVRITTNPGETFVDKMIALVEGAQRQKTPNEIALTILLSGLTIVFLLVVITLPGFAAYSGVTLSNAVLISLLV
jgi:K+-transporting ATPase ATPase B chain